MSETICDAIAQLQLLRFVYDGETRIVEPHACGVSRKGKEVLRAWQRGDGWRLYSLAKMDRLEVLAEVFDGPRPGYSAQDSHMERVFCAL